MRILVTGATGYIGGRVVPWLIEAGHDVRCLAGRRPVRSGLLRHELGMGASRAPRQARRGVGLRRGRRHPEILRPGEALDFWRVSSVEQGAALELYAETRRPGEAWLAFRAIGDGDATVLEQTAYFAPRDLLGRQY